MKKIGLVLEGGAARGVYTAGVLDYWMEQGISFPYLVGVSAGACNGLDLVSGQIGRTRDCMIHTDKKYAYTGLKVLWRKHVLMDMDMIFRRYPNKYFPFDFDAYFKSEVYDEYCCTNCLTGEAEFFHERQSKKRLMEIGKASCTMPGAAPAVLLEGTPYLDGGLSDSIPIQRAFDMGCEKLVVVQTRNPDFRMTLGRSVKLMGKMYQQYPMVEKLLLRRPQTYNKRLAEIRRLEKEGKILSFRPEIPVVGRMETDYHKLMQFYLHGYRHAQQRQKELEDFLKD